MILVSSLLWESGDKPIFHGAVYISSEHLGKGCTRFLKAGWVAVIFLLLVFSLVEHAPVRATSAQKFSNVYLSPVSYNSTVGSSFTVNVMLNLTAGQNISGFDVKLNYTNPQPTCCLVRAVNLSYSGNIFGDAQSNFVSKATPTVVVGHQTIFDASGSFNATSPAVRIKNYSWDFGDGTTTSSTNPIVLHTFGFPRGYDVTLNVTDANGSKGSFHEFVVVGPALGALLLTVYSLQKVLQSGVLVRIFNSSAASPFENATTGSGGEVVFPSLSPGDYNLAFSGQFVKSARNVTETIIAGWTTQDSVGIEVDTPPSPSPTPWYGDVVFLASLGGALGVFGFGLFLRRRSRRKKLRANRANLKKR